MKCDRLLPLLLEAAENRENELSATDRQRLRAHLAECAACRQAIAEQRAVRNTLTARADADPPPDLAAQVVARLATGASWSDVFQWRTWTLRLAPVAAVLGLVALTGGGGVSESSEPAGLADLTESWAFVESELDARPAFTLLGRDDVSGGDLLEAVLSAEPDDLPIVGNSL